MIKLYKPLILQGRDQDFDIPIVSIILACVAMLVSMMAGLFLNYKFQSVALRITKFTSYLAFLSILIQVILAFIVFPRAIGQQTWEMWLIGFLQPVLGGLAGYVLAFILVKSYIGFPCVEDIPRKLVIYKTIAIETAIQNLRVPSNVIAYSFLDCPSGVNQMVFYPTVCSVYQFLFCFIFKYGLKKYRQDRKNTLQTKNLQKIAAVASSVDESNSESNFYDQISL